MLGRIQKVIYSLQLNLITSEPEPCNFRVGPALSRRLDQRTSSDQVYPKLSCNFMFLCLSLLQERRRNRKGQGIVSKESETSVFSIRE